jgi:hypothetical protein
MSSSESVFSQDPDGFIYTFENTLSLSSSDSISSETLEEESTPGTVKATGKLWNKGTLWVHEIA